MVAVLYLYLVFVLRIIVYMCVNLRSVNLFDLEVGGASSF